MMIPSTSVARLAAIDLDGLGSHWIWSPLDRTELDTALAALANGDRGAFDTVWSCAAPKVRALVRRLVTDPAEADDVAQITLCKVFERASEFDPDRPALPWILGIASWEVRTSRRKRQRSRELAVPAMPPCATDAPGPEAALIDADLKAAPRRSRSARGGTRAGRSTRRRRRHLPEAGPARHRAPAARLGRAP